MATLPPGVVHNAPLFEVAIGGEDREWAPYEKVKQYTNAFIKQEGKLLLGYKKRGIGQGLFNGFGGKVDPGESSLEAALRELKEEAGIDAPLRECGTLFFHVPGLDAAFEIHIFVANGYTGTIIETEEMRPQWFSTKDLEVVSEIDNSAEQLLPIPYDKMWADDIHWMPLLLAGDNFAGRADFAQDEATLIKWWFGKEGK